MKRTFTKSHLFKQRLEQFGGRSNIPPVAIECVNKYIAENKIAINDIDIDHIKYALRGAKLLCYMGYAHSIYNRITETKPVDLNQTLILDNALFINKQVDNLNIPEEVCSICLDSFDINDIVLTECNHYYHCGCIKEWNKIKAECPYCKTKLEIKSAIISNECTPKLISIKEQLMKDFEKLKSENPNKLPPMKHIIRQLLENIIEENKKLLEI